MIVQTQITQARQADLLRLLEPAPPEEMLDEIWPSDDALSALRLIPQTIIFVAEKG